MATPCRILMNNAHTKIKGKWGMNNRKELDEIMLSFPQGVPIGHPGMKNGRKENVTNRLQPF